MVDQQSVRKRRCSLRRERFGKAPIGVGKGLDCTRKAILGIDELQDTDDLAFVIDFAATSIDSSSLLMSRSCESDTPISMSWSSRCSRSAESEAPLDVKSSSESSLLRSPSCMPDDPTLLNADSANLLNVSDA